MAIQDEQARVNREKAIDALIATQIAPPPFPSPTPPGPTLPFPALTAEEYDKLVKKVTYDITKDVVANLAKTFPNRDEVLELSKEAIPPVFRGTSSSMPSGKHAMLGPDGTMVFGRLEIPEQKITGGGIDTDMIIIGGIKYLESSITGVKTHFLEIDRSADTPTLAWIAAMPDNAGPFKEVYDVTKNHIHLPGMTA